MRRSTAAVVGTLSGAALIVGVRLSVQPPAAPVAAPPPVDLAAGTPTPKPKPSKSAAGNKSGATSKPAAPKSGLKDGVYKGKGASNPYGTVQVQIRVEGGEITAAEATYPTTADSATINPPAVATLKQETLGAKSAKDVDAVSGATYTSKSYAESLQAALDAAKA
ncbi:FMN-binding protein [Actinoplanes sp. NPDC049596]|uniref:FMN-binding protein n=1 Tax=unclassified Actinoplanes TaxID=2626549 RepID=UPI00342CF0EE